MTASEQVLVNHLQEAAHNTERAYWWLKSIDSKAAKELGIDNELEIALGLLSKVFTTVKERELKIRQK